MSSEKEVLTTVIRIPDEEIVVTRKMPMTEETSSQLRAIRATREKELSQEWGEPVQLPYPTLFAQMVEEEFNRQEVKQDGQ